MQYSFVRGAPSQPPLFTWESLHYLILELPPLRPSDSSSDSVVLDQNALHCACRRDVANSATLHSVTRATHAGSDAMAVTCEFPERLQRKIGYRRPFERAAFPVFGSGCNTNINEMSVVPIRSAPPPLRDVAAAADARAAACRTKMRRRSWELPPPHCRPVCGRRRASRRRQVGRPANTQIPCAPDFYKTTSVQKNEMTVMRRPQPSR
jgi:hypothetical protein